MTTFNYKPRTLRDQAVRAIQTATETDRSPRAEPEALCTRCHHPKWAHCDVRRSVEKRTVLFVARCRGEYIWQRHCGGYGSALSAYKPVICRHSTDDQADFPCCNSSACAVRGCPCTAFVSPFRKTRKKTATTGRTKRQKAVGQGELFEIVAGVGKE